MIDTPAKEGILDIFCCNSSLWKYNYNASSLYNNKKGTMSGLKLHLGNCLYYNYISICTNNKKKRGMSRGYRPSSDLQVTFSAYLGTFNVCLQNLLNCTFVKMWQQFRSPYFQTIESRNSCWARASKSLFLSLRIRRLEVTVQERTGHARDTREGRGSSSPLACFIRVPRSFLRPLLASVWYAGYLFLVLTDSM